MRLIDAIDAIGALLKLVEHRCSRVYEGAAFILQRRAMLHLMSSDSVLFVVECRRGLLWTV